MAGMTLPDLVAFLATNRLTLRSAQFEQNRVMAGAPGDPLQFEQDRVMAFSCDPFPEPPADVHVHLETDDGIESEGDALAKFLGHRGGNQ